MSHTFSGKETQLKMTKHPLFTISIEDLDLPPGCWGQRVVMTRYPVFNVDYPFDKLIKDKGKQCQYRHGDPIVHDKSMSIRRILVQLGYDLERHFTSFNGRVSICFQRGTHEQHQAARYVLHRLRPRGSLRPPRGGDFRAAPTHIRKLKGFS